MAGAGPQREGSGVAKGHTVGAGGLLEPAAGPQWGGVSVRGWQAGASKRGSRSVLLSEGGATGQVAEVTTLSNFRDPRSASEDAIALAWCWRLLQKGLPGPLRGAVTSVPSAAGVSGAGGGAHIPCARPPAEGCLVVPERPASCPGPGRAPESPRQPTRSLPSELSLATKVSGPRRVAPRLLPSQEHFCFSAVTLGSGFAPVKRDLGKIPTP